MRYLQAIALIVLIASMFVQFNRDWTSSRALRTAYWSTLNAELNRYSASDVE